MDSWQIQQAYGLEIIAALLVGMAMAASCWIYLRKMKAAPKKARPKNNIEAARMRAADRLATRPEMTAEEPQQPATALSAAAAAPEANREDEAPVATQVETSKPLYERMGMDEKRPEPAPALVYAPAPAPTPAPTPMPAPAPAPAPVPAPTPEQQHEPAPSPKPVEPDQPPEKEPEPLSPKEAFKKALAEHNAQIGRAQKAYKQSLPVEQQRHPTWERTYENPTYDKQIEPTRSSEKPRLRISYSDSNGEMTTRQIDVREYSLAYKSMEAYCHLRKAHRTFYFNSVKDAIDMETGEQIRDLSKYFEDVYKQTPQYEIDQFLDQHEDALFVLFCMAKADGNGKEHHHDLCLLYWRHQPTAKQQRHG